MSFLGRVRSLFAPSKVEDPARPAAPVPAGDLTLAPEDAERIRTQNVREWTDRLEREANRTGNRRLAQQARNIRSRFGFS